MWHLHLTLACRLTKNDRHARKNVQRLHQFFQTSLLTLCYLDHSFECLFPPTSSMFIFSLSYCEPVQLRRALAYLGLSCHLSSSPAPHQPGTTLVLLQDFQFYCAVASCGVLFRLSSRSKKLTLKYQWFNIQRLISQSQYLSKVWGFTVLKLHQPSCYIRGKELGELTPALRPGNASAPMWHAPMLLAAHRPELVTRSDLTARESGKCSFSRGRKIKWRLRATRCVCILWLETSFKWG